jgi:hypothetical protein
MPTRTLARPLVILMTCGFRLAGFLRAAPAPEPAVDAAFGSPARFEPQKAVARRRARIVAGAGLLTGALTAAGLLISIF